jgi:hypothetical protein
MDANQIKWPKVEGKTVTVVFNLQPGQTIPDRLTGEIQRLGPKGIIIYHGNGSFSKALIDIDCIEVAEVGS